MALLPDNRDHDQQGLDLFARRLGSHAAGSFSWLELRSQSVLVAHSLLLIPVRGWYALQRVAIEEVSIGQRPARREVIGADLWQGKSKGPDRGRFGHRVHDSHL